MIDLQIVSDFVYEHFERVSVSKNGTHFLARCAICGDSKKSKSKRRFNLDYNGGNPIYHCFNCEGDMGSGSFMQLYSYMNGISIEETIKLLTRFDVENLTRQLSPRKVEKMVKEIGYENHNWILDDCVMPWDEPDSIVGTTALSKLKEFIEKRKIPSEYMIGIAYKGDYKGRIIIPVFDGNRDIVYFQARRIPDSGIEPKYKNPTVLKGNIILNKFRLRSDKYVIITEGLIDAFMIGSQGTSCIGAYISDDFLKEIFSISTKVIVAFDNDQTGYREMIRFMEGKKGRGRKKGRESSRYNKKVRYFIMPREYGDCKDINNIVEKYNVQDIYSMMVNNSYPYSSAYVLLKTDKSLKKLFND